MALHHDGALALLALTLISFGIPTEAEAGGDPLEVIAVRPAAQRLTAPVTAPIFILFNQPVDRATIGNDSFWAFGRWSGTANGRHRFLLQDRLVVLRPDRPFSHGERVMVVLSRDIRGADGTPLRAGGYSFQFWTATRPSAAPLSFAGVLSTRSVPSQTTRAYGGVGTDLNNDGWLDLTIVNEDTGDLRVFLNRADGSGQFEDFIRPVTPVNRRASPSEPSDFDRDGNADLAVANIDTDSVSVVLGNGDGTFDPQQEITVGVEPRGIAVLDADGDGDTDIVNTNSGGPRGLSILLNDGNGVFAEPVFFGDEDSVEWALAAADMNGDGILDLVSGSQDFADPTIDVRTGNGDGTFTLTASASAGAPVWMLTTGDLSGDGFEDVAAVNNSSNTGLTLLGDGAGGLSPPSFVTTDPFPLATDLGDLDGDGDLDWVTSSFSGDWLVFDNDGAGGFVLRREFPAPRAASCALMLDVDNDGDLDLALVDELADVVLLYLQ